MLDASALRFPSFFIEIDDVSMGQSIPQHSENLANAALVQAKTDALPDRIVVYTMRHTAISEWLREGVDIGRVAKATGTSVVMIQKHYQKFIPQDFVERLSHVQVV